MTRSIIFFLFLIVSSFTDAALLSLRIVNMLNEPVAGATLYIHQISQGIATANDGMLQVYLEPGSYTCEFRSLGYESVIREIIIGLSDHDEMVTMMERSYQLPEVGISAKGEDPAYKVMRRAISMAPWHLTQINGYDSEVYLKGRLKITDMPDILKKRINLTSNSVEIGNKSSEEEFDFNQIFLIESKHLISYNAPGSYDNKIMAIQSTVPDVFKDNIFPFVITGTIYSPEAFGCISPLAPDAFSYYRFALEGISMEGDHLVNKIRVIPGKKNPDLMNGYIYIVDQSWNVRQLDLEIKAYGVSLRFNTFYNEVRSGVFMPTSYDIDMKLSIMGIKAEGKYFTSVKLLDIHAESEPGYLHNEAAKEAGASVVAEETKVGNFVDKEQRRQQKKQAELDRLMSKDELTNRDALRMAGLMKSMRSKERDDRMLEDKDSRVITTTKDTLAECMDSAYWAMVRTVPLLGDEIAGYERAETLRHIHQPAVDSSSINRKWKVQFIGKAMTGHNWEGNRFSFGFSGLIRSVPEYNFVDGLWLGQRLEFGYKSEKGISFKSKPSAYYATARRLVNWNVENKFGYASLRNGVLSIDIGDRSEDYNGADGSSRFINSISSLGFGVDPVKFYRNRFFSISNSVDISNGLRLAVGSYIAGRDTLMNHTTYNFSGREPEPNLLPDQYRTMPSSNIFKSTVRLEYTPRQHYRIVNNRKTDMRSAWPTFIIEWQEAIKTTRQQSVSYSRISFGLTQNAVINGFNDLSYHFESGMYMNPENVYYTDFRHFAAHGLMVSNQPLHKAFSFDNYSYATDKRWIEGGVVWNSQYLFLKNLPFMQMLPLEESIHVGSLWIPSVNYTELGYSIGIKNIIQAGVFVGFDNGRYSSAGFAISIPFVRF